MCGFDWSLCTVQWVQVNHREKWENEQENGTNSETAIDNGGRDRDIVLKNGHGSCENRELASN